MTGLRCASLFLFAIHAFSSLGAQAIASPPKSDRLFSCKNSLGVFAEYSNDSSHILMGRARNRKLATFGITYTHRLFLRKLVDTQYMAEVRPVLFESDPLTHVTETYSGPPKNFSLSYDNVYVPSCSAKTITVNETYTSGPYTGTPYTIVITRTCSRQWTFGQGISPAGIKFNLLPHHRLQPVFTANAGYAFSTRPIPISSAGSFNFTFGFGAGLEFYRQQTRSDSLFGNRSLRAEYRFHHISNAHSATDNPGIDSGLFQVSFNFGR